MVNPPIKNRTCIIWRITDGKPGHENQSLGLCLALEELVEIQRFDLPVRGRLGYLLQWAAGSFPAGKELPRPDLIIGAGHSTHLPMLAAHRAFGGRTVVLMRPSLPCGLFDLCLVPEHDLKNDRTTPGIENGRVLPTKGVLNTIRPVAEQTRDRTLILIGGPSAHFGWQPESLLEQIRTVVAAASEEHYLLTTSRRTPAGFAATVRDLRLANLEILPVEQTPGGWVAEQLGRSRTAWVSEDSVSMVYEALTAGARVGLLEVPRNGESRVTRGVDRLANAGRLRRFSEWQPGAALPQSGERFDEAGRCARWIQERWLNND